MFGFLAALLLFFNVPSVIGVDRSKFRTCADTRFCRKYRQPTQFGQSSNKKLDEAFSIPFESIVINNNEFQSKLQSLQSKNEYNLFITSQIHGSIRIKITENTNYDNNIPPRWQPTELLLTEGLMSGTLKKINLHEQNNAHQIHLPNNLIKTIKDSNNEIIPLAISSAYSTTKTETSVLLVYTNPMKFELYKDTVHVVTINDRQLFHYETSSVNGRKLNEKVSLYLIV